MIEKLPNRESGLNEFPGMIPLTRENRNKINELVDAVNFLKKSTNIRQQMYEQRRAGDCAKARWAYINAGQKWGDGHAFWYCDLLSARCAENWKSCPLLKPIGNAQTLKEKDE